MSTSKQAEYGISLEQQREALKKEGAETIYEDVMSGKTTSRPEFDALLKASSDGDTVLVYELSRLGRNSLHIQQTINDLIEKGVTVRSLTEPIFNGDKHITQMLVAILATLNEMERERISRRTRDALQAKKARGEKLGASKVVDNPQKRELVKKVHKLRQKGNSYGQIAKLLGISKPTVSRYAKIQIKM